MKRGLLFLFLFLFPLVSASPEINLQSEDILEGEPIIGTISYNETYKEEILKGDVKFYKGRRETFFEFDIKFYGGVHYFYIFANRPGEFRMEIDTQFYENEILKFETIIKNFTVNESGNETLEIRPALLDITSGENITLRNVGNNSLNVSFNEEDISISPLESYDIYLEGTELFEVLEIKTYKTFNVPIFRIITIVPPLIPGSIDLRASKESLKFITTIGIEKKSFIELFNFAEKNLTDMQFISSSSMIKPEKIKELGAKETSNITINLSPKEEGTFEEFLKITYLIGEERYNISIPIEIFILPSGTNVTDLEESEETCSELNGKNCELGESCDGRPKFTKGGDYCCIGTCTEAVVKRDDSNNNLIIGLLIAAALALIGYGVYDRVKKSKSKSGTQTLMEKGKSISKRISGGLQRN